jgi:hypothetical protein
MTSVPAPVTAPTPEEILQVSALVDPLIRNLRITECYARLSQGMTAQTGGCANWCTFATWASRQAGSSIRGEDFARRLAACVSGGASIRYPFQSLWRAILRKGIFNPQTFAGRIVRCVHSPFDAFERASDAVARGNRKVFEEIGLIFAKYLRSSDLSAFMKELRPGPPPDGQELLRRAFMRYHHQRTETEPRKRAQMIFLANIEIGLHEQTRLQPEIAEAMDAGPDTADDLGSRLLGLVLLPGYRAFVRRAARSAITETMMVLRLPGGELALGQHLDRQFAADLQEVTDPELAQLLEDFEPQGACADCGVDDWSNLAERMHYIIHLFRAFHADAALLRPPFTPEQVRLITAGKLPLDEL